MLSATKQLSPADEILREAKDDKRRGSLLRLMHGGPIMVINKLMGILEKPARADKSAMCAINRHLRMAG